jgi:hypothetical protein
MSITVKQSNTASALYKQVFADYQARVNQHTGRYAPICQQREALCKAYQLVHSSSSPTAYSRYMRAMRKAHKQILTYPVV